MTLHQCNLSDYPGDVVGRSVNTVRLPLRDRTGQRCERCGIESAHFGAGGARLLMVPFGTVDPNPDHWRVLCETCKQSVKSIEVDDSIIEMPVVTAPGGQLRLFA